MIHLPGEVICVLCREPLGIDMTDWIGGPVEWQGDRPYVTCSKCAEEECECGVDDESPCEYCELWDQENCTCQMVVDFPCAIHAETATENEQTKP